MNEPYRIIRSECIANSNNKVFELIEDLEERFKRLEAIIIKLIDQQKKMQIELRGIKSKYEALVEIVNKLIIGDKKK